MKTMLTDSHSLFGLLIITCATLLVVLGSMTVDQWVTTTQWIFTAFMSGHTAMTVARTLSSRSVPPTATVVGGDAGKQL
jgi:hypothetical protein